MPRFLSEYLSEIPSRDELDLYASLLLDENEHSTLVIEKNPHAEIRQKHDESYLRGPDIESTDEMILHVNQNIDEKNVDRKLEFVGAPLLEADNRDIDEQRDAKPVVCVYAQRPHLRHAIAQHTRFFASSQSIPYIIQMSGDFPGPCLLKAEDLHHRTGSSGGMQLPPRLNMRFTLLSMAYVKFSWR
jgi:hypothetical protein